MSKRRNPNVPNQPETYLTPQERQTVNRLLGFPEEFPQKFIAWLDDHLRVNIPQFPITQVKGFQNFQQDFNRFVLGESGWEFIEAKGDMISGFGPGQIAVLVAPDPSDDGSVLVADSTQPGGIAWDTTGSTGTGASVKRELAVVFSGPAQAVSSNTAMSIGITPLLAARGTIKSLRAFVTTPGSTATTISVGSGVSDDPITIPASDNWDDGSDTFNDPSVANENIIPITVTSAGTGAYGLTVIVTL